MARAQAAGLSVRNTEVYYNGAIVLPLYACNIAVGFLARRSSSVCLCVGTDRRDRIQVVVYQWQIGSSFSASSIAGRIQIPIETPQESSTVEPPEPPEPEPEPEEVGPIDDGKANAAIIMLARNTELDGALSSMRQFEEKFNHRFHYPWIFLNEEPFTNEFKELVELFYTHSKIAF